MGRRRECIPGHLLKQNETEATPPRPGSKFSSLLWPHPAKNHPWDPSRDIWARAMSRDNVSRGRNRSPSSNDSVEEGLGCISRARDPGWRDSKQSLEQGRSQDGLEQMAPCSLGHPLGEACTPGEGPSRPAFLVLVGLERCNRTAP